MLILQPAPTAETLEDDLPFSLLAELALGGFRSRATNRLRHDAGLTYGIRPHIVRSRSLGMLAITTAIEASEASTAIKELLGTLDALQRSPVSNEELTRAKLSFLGHFERAVGHEQTLARMRAAGFAEGQKARFLSELRERLRAIDAEDLRRVARRYLKPRDVEIGVAGGTSIARELDALGHLSVYTILQR